MGLFDKVKETLGNAADKAKEAAEIAADKAKDLAETAKRYPQYTALNYFGRKISFS